MPAVDFKTAPIAHKKGQFSGNPQHASYDLSYVSTLVRLVIHISKYLTIIVKKNHTSYVALPGLQHLVLCCILTSLF